MCDGGYISGYGETGIARQHGPSIQLARCVRNRVEKNEPTAIPSVPNLFAANLDPETAAHAYKEKVVGPYRGKIARSCDRYHGGAIIRCMYS
ncbi:hypothetical protein GCM10020331_093450 [Ectobacillus funiculus]